MSVNPNKASSMFTLVNVTFPVLVTTKLYVIISPAEAVLSVPKARVPSFVTAIDGAGQAVTAIVAGVEIFPCVSAIVY